MKNVTSHLTLVSLVMTSVDSTTLVPGVVMRDGQTFYMKRMEKMIDLEQKNVINKLLVLENVDELVLYMLEVYGSDAEHSAKLISWITNITSKQLQLEHAKVLDYSFAMDGMIASSQTKFDVKEDFMLRLSTCYAHLRYFDFRNYWSKSEKEYFDAFVQILKDKNDFDYEDSSDMEWLRITNHERYLWTKRVIKKFVEEDNDGV